MVVVPVPINHSGLSGVPHRLRITSTSLCRKYTFLRQLATVNTLGHAEVVCESEQIEGVAECDCPF